MKKSFVGIIVLLAVLFIAVVSFFSASNKLVVLREEVELQKSQVATTLQRRSDLIPNLVETVKGYTSHEEKVFTEIAEARAQLAGSIESGDLEAMSEANDAISASLGRLLAIQESYPELKASEQFIALQDEIAGTENRIAVSRQYYNDAVRAYNTKIKMFPTSIIANMTGHESMPYFEASSGAEEAPTISFS